MVGRSSGVGGLAVQVDGESGDKAGLAGDYLAKISAGWGELRLAGLSPEDAFDGADCSGGARGQRAARSEQRRLTDRQ